MSMTTIICRDCRGEYSYEARRGRPAVRCPPCKEKFLGASGSNPQPIERLDATLYNKDAAPITVPVASPKNTILGALAKASSESTLEVQEVVAPAVDATYEVYVTNMGWAYRGEDINAARGTFKHYSEASAQGFGQVGFECVSMYDSSDKESPRKLVDQNKPKRRGDSEV
jgi:hypothetical protein